MKKYCFLIYCFCFVLIANAQLVTDSITRKPPLRGNFRWIIDKDMYEEGQIINNIKVGEWLRFYKNELTGKTVYKNGLAISEYWINKEVQQPRYILSSDADSMYVYSYNLDLKIEKEIKYLINKNTFFLNYSLMTEDTLFKKTPLTEITYTYSFWRHRNDVVVVKEKTAGIENTKYLLVKNGKTSVWFETNDKGDFITGKKKEFLKEEEISKKITD